MDKRSSDGGSSIDVAKNTTAAADWVWCSDAFHTNDTIFLVGNYTFWNGSSRMEPPLLSRPGGAVSLLQEHGFVLPRAS